MVSITLNGARIFFFVDGGVLGGVDLGVGCVFWIANNGCSEKRIMIVCRPAIRANDQFAVDDDGVRNVGG